MSWSTGSGHSLLCLLSVSTWISRGHATMSWLVFIFAPHLLRSLCASNLFVVLVHHLEWDVSADFVKLHQLGRTARELQVGFEEEGGKVRVFLRTWDIDNFRRVCVATVDRYSSDPHREIAAFGRIVDALGPDVLVVSISGKSTVLVEASCKYLGSGYRQKLIDYPFFDLRLFKRCLQRTVSSVSGSLDGLAMTKFIVNRLKGGEARNWTSSRPALKNPS